MLQVNIGDQNLTLTEDLEVSRYDILQLTIML